MSYVFTETFDILIPDIEQRLNEFSEGSFNGAHGLVIELAAIHVGATANFNYYSEEALTESINSWLDPHPKPIIMNHDPYSEPIGRVMGAKMDKEADGTPYARLQAAILDPTAIEKVADGRYLTGSVGGRSKEALCSICKVDWANPTAAFELPCKHRRGKVYNGKVAMMEMKNISFKEYSIVNMPADTKSGIRKIGADEAVKDTWVKPARFFVLDMVEESILEYTESESKEVLEGMRRKEYLPMYTGLKGAFILAQGIHEEELSIKDSGNLDKPDTNTVNDLINEEIEMPLDNAAAIDEEDILAVVEGLSEDLSAQADKDTKDEESEGSTDEESEDETSEEDEDENSDEEAANDSEEKGKPTGQEKPSGDVDPNNSDGAPVNREEEEDTDTEGDEESTEEDASDETANSEANEEEEKPELTNEENVIEPQIATLTQRVSELEEENKKLKTRIKADLVERVVDTKIALGLLEIDARASAIVEHTDRTGASLADSLRDLANMEPNQVTLHDGNKTLEMEQNLGVVGNENNVTTIGDEEVQEKVDPLVAAENLFIDVLMGRKKA